MNIRLGNGQDVQAVSALYDALHDYHENHTNYPSWKYWFDEEVTPLRKEAEKLQFMLAQEGVKIFGVTLDHSNEEIRRTKQFSLIKAGEILAWLAVHDEIKRWVVIDDLNLHNEEVAQHQVRTDASVGLTLKDVQIARENVE